MKLNLVNRQFHAVSNVGSGEVDGRTRFTYRQNGDVIWATYAGGDIRFGTLTGLMDDKGSLRFAYQHVNTQNEIMTEDCVSTPEILPDGRIRYHEEWQWTSGDCSSGHSVIEEILTHSTSAQDVSV